MRRVFALVLALLLAWGALRLFPAGEIIAPSLLRDALFLVIPALILAAVNGLPWVSPPRNERAWPSAARALLIAGLITSVAGVLLNRANVGTLLLAAAPVGTIVWATGIVLVLAAALFPGKVERYAAPAFRWKRDAHGDLVRDLLNRSEPVQIMGRAWWVAAALVLVAGAALRIWLVRGMPPVCLPGECAALPGAGTFAGTSPSMVLASLLRPLAQDPLRALRLGQAGLSILTLALFPLALRDLLSPAGRLLGLALLAFNPWTLRLLTQGTPGAEIPLLVLLVFEGSATALTRPMPRAWVVPGVALGVLTGAAPSFAPAWIVWLLLLAGLALLRPRPSNWRSPVYLLAAALAAAAPWWLTAPAQTTRGFTLLAAGDLLTRANELAQWAMQPGALWVAALAVAGAGAFTRYGVRALVVLGGLAILLTAVATTQVLPLPGELWTPLSAWLILFAAVACDQFVRAFLRAVAMKEPSQRWAPAFAALIVVLSAGTVLTMVRTPQSAVLAADDKVAVAVIEYVNRLRADAGTAPTLAPTIVLVQPGVLNHPAVRVALAADMQAGLLRPFVAQRDLPLAGDVAGDVMVVLPRTELATLQLLAAAYPRGAGVPVADDSAGLTAFRLDGPSLVRSRGLEQYLYAGDALGSADEAEIGTTEAPLLFDWLTAPPAALPFSAEWQGSLLVRAAGEHAFSVLAPPQSTFSLLLDGRLVLDTSAGLIAHVEILAAGAYQLQMRYRSGPMPGDLAVYWQPPDGPLEPIPASALHNPPLPDQGLLAVYTAGTAWQGETLLTRKDLMIEPDTSLAAPWSVEWQGQFAAARAGEYLIGAVGNGAVLVDIGGRRVINRTLDGDEDNSAATAMTAANEGSIYLPRGWHRITIRYATEGPAPELKLYWQPPGIGPQPLDATFLTPSPGTFSPADLPLPSLPPADAALGDDEFALSGEISFWNTTISAPPDARVNGLPALPFERMWSVGSCGVEITQFSSPHGVAFDAARRLLLVADTGNRRVLLLELDDGLPSLAPFPELEEPVDVAILPTGDWLVLDTLAPRLVRYSLNTEESQTITLGEGFYRPRGMDVDASGMVYLADTGGARIAVVDSAGALNAQFGGPATALGLGQPVDVAATGRALWVIAAEGGRLWQLDTLGSLLVSERNDTLDGPHLAAVEGSGALFLSDPARSQILYLSERGEPRGVLNDAGAFQRPTGVDALRDGDNLYLAVSDTAACSVGLWRALVTNLP